MGLTLAQKIIKAHLVDGEMTVGTDVGLKIDQTLTQDATGTMAYLAFEGMVYLADVFYVHIFKL